MEDDTCNVFKASFSDRYSVGELSRYQPSTARAAPGRRGLTDTAAKRCHFFDVAPEGLLGARRGGRRERGREKDEEVEEEDKNDWERSR
jgi:hypothetical protein